MAGFGSIRSKLVMLAAIELLQDKDGGMSFELGAYGMLFPGKLPFASDAEPGGLWSGYKAF
jgi:hypothetical protein